MKLKQLMLAVLTVITFHSQVYAGEESNIDFRVDSAELERGDDQIAFEWQTPDQFRATRVALTDHVKVNKLSPQNLHMVNAKIAMISNRPFEDFTLKKLSTATMVKDMLRSTSVVPQGNHTYRVANKVKAYGLPFTVKFTLAVKEIQPDAVTAKYFREQAVQFEGSGRESFATLDMTDFSQIMHRNYSAIYAKELKDGRTLIIATIMAGFDLDKANSYFNFPPFSRTQSTMVNNLRSQTVHMLKEMKN